jgi:hypothetical protein
MTPINSREIFPLHLNVLRFTDYILDHILLKTSATVRKFYTYTLCVMFQLISGQSFDLQTSPQLIFSMSCNTLVFFLIHPFLPCSLTLSHLLIRCNSIFLYLYSFIISNFCLSSLLTFWVGGGGVPDRGAGCCLGPEGNGVSLGEGGEGGPGPPGSKKDKQSVLSESRDNMEKEEKERASRAWWRRTGVNRVSYFPGWRLCNQYKLCVILK